MPQWNGIIAPNSKPLKIHGARIKTTTENTLISARNTGGSLHGKSFLIAESTVHATVCVQNISNQSCQCITAYAICRTVNIHSHRKPSTRPRGHEVFNFAPFVSLPLADRSSAVLHVFQMCTEKPCADKTPQSPSRTPIIRATSQHHDGVPQPTTEQCASYQARSWPKCPSHGPDSFVHP